jgi:hypothetical protein
VFKITHILTANLRQVIMHCFIIFSEVIIGLVHIVPPAAVVSLSDVVQDAMEQEIPCGHHKSKFPHWDTSSLRYYIRGKNVYRRLKNPIVV